MLYDLFVKEVVTIRFVKLKRNILKIEKDRKKLVDLSLV